MYPVAASAAQTGGATWDHHSQPERRRTAEVRGQPGREPVRVELAGRGNLRRTATDGTQRTEPRKRSVTWHRRAIGGAAGSGRALAPRGRRPSRRVDGNLRIRAGRGNRASDPAPSHSEYGLSAQFVQT